MRVFAAEWPAPTTRCAVPANRARSGAEDVGESVADAAGDAVGVDGSETGGGEGVGGRVGAGGVDDRAGEFVAHLAVVVEAQQERGLGASGGAGAVHALPGHRGDSGPYRMRRTSAGRGEGFEVVADEVGTVGSFFAPGLPSRWCRGGGAAAGSMTCPHGENRRVWPHARTAVAALGRLRRRRRRGRARGAARQRRGRQGRRR